MCLSGIPFLHLKVIVWNSQISGYYRKQNNPLEHTTKQDRGGRSPCLENPPKTKLLVKDQNTYQLVNYNNFS